MKDRLWSWPDSFSEIGVDVPLIRQVDGLEKTSLVSVFVQMELNLGGRPKGQDANSADHGVSRVVLKAQILDNVRHEGD